MNNNGDSTQRCRILSCLTSNHYECLSLYVRSQALIKSRGIAGCLCASLLAGECTTGFVPLVRVLEIVAPTVYRLLIVPGEIDTAVPQGVSPDA